MDCLWLFGYSWDRLYYQQDTGDFVMMIKLIKQYGWRRYWKYRSYYNKKRKGDVVDSYISFSMMYYPEDIEAIEDSEMKSGKTGIYKIISVTGIDDWGSKDIKKDFIGYEGIKPIRDCTLEEFMDLYKTYFKIKGEKQND